MKMMFLYTLCIASLNGTLRNLESAFNFATSFEAASGIYIEQIQQTSDRGFIMTGSSQIDGNTRAILVVKLDSVGQLEWARKFEQTNEQLQGVSIHEISDGGYLLGANIVGLSGSPDMGIFKLNSIGETQFVNAQGNNLEDNIVNLIEFDNYYIVAGRVTNQGNGNMNIEIIYIDYVNPHTSERNQISQTLDQVLIAFKQSRHGGFLFCGHIKQTPNSYYDIFLSKISADSLSIDWKKEIGIDTLDTRCTDMIESALSNTIYVLGYIVTAGNQGVLVAKVTHDASSLLWLKKYGTGSPQIDASSIQETQNGDILITGSYINGAKGISRILMIHLTQDGQLVKARTFEGNAQESPQTIIRLQSGGYVLAGNEWNQSALLKMIIFSFDSNLQNCKPLSYQFDELMVESDITNTQFLDIPNAWTILSSIFTPTGFLIDNYLYTSQLTPTYEPSCLAQSISNQIITAISALKPCSCSQFGECAPSGRCKCTSFYRGLSCQFSNPNFQFLQAQISAAVSSLSSSLRSFPPLTILNQYLSVCKTPQLLNQQSALTVLQDVSTLISGSSTTNELTVAFDILSQIAQTTTYLSQSSLTLTHSLQATILQELLSKVILNQPIAISSSTINGGLYSATSLVNDRRIQISGNLFSTDIQFPEEIFTQSDNMYISAVIFESNIYSSLDTSDGVVSNPIVSVNLFKNGALFQISKLTSPVIIQFSHNSNNTFLSRIITDLFNQRNLTLNEIKAKKYVECVFFNPETKILDSTGCELQDITRDETICKCFHLTDFMVFVKGSYEILFNSNYDAITAIGDLNQEKLEKNTGFYFSLAYFSSFLILAISCDLRDSSRKSKLELLRKELKIPRTDKYKISQSRHQHESTNQNTSSQNLTFQQNHSQFGDHSHSNRPAIGFSILISSFKEKQKFTGKKKQNSNGVSEMDKIYIQSSQRRCCCFILFFKFLFFQLISNNQIYLLLCFPSLLIPRSLRLAFFYLGILVDICLNALFHNLNQQEESDTDAFAYESLVENFWVGFYSVLISLMVMSILSLALAAGSTHQKKKLIIASQKNELTNAYNRIACNAWCRCCIGMIFFSLLSSFFCLYLIGFYQRASSTAQSEFKVSTLSSIFIDLILFQIIPGFAIATVGLLVFGCRVKCCNFILVLILGYRAIRNFVGF